MFLRFCYWWDVKPPRGFLLSSEGLFPSSLNEPLVLLFFLFIFFLFSYRMARGYEEVSSSQAGCRMGTPREMPTASCLVTTMSSEEPRLYNQVPIEISMEMSDDPTTSTVGEADNAIYFTLE